MAASEFDFVLLPEILFIKILRYLPWREIFRSRRVGNRWMEMGNKALALETKSIGPGDDRFKGMQITDLERLLPIVASGLEVLRFQTRCAVQSEPPFVYATDLNVDSISSLSSFRRLRELNLGELGQLPLQTIFFFLEKSPHLKILITPIQAPLSSWSGASRKYELEKLELRSDCALTDPDIVKILDCFPKLTSIRMGTGFVSCSCVSFLVNKYGDQLTHLEINGGGEHTGMEYAPLGAFDGISACPNLVEILLTETDHISNVFLAALSTSCISLDTLDMWNSREITNDGLAMLASLPSLKRLDISCTDQDLSDGISTIASNGVLEQLVASDITVSATCLKTCVRYCSHLRLLDIRGNDANVSVDDAVEILQLYGRYGAGALLCVRTNAASWKDENVNEKKADILETHNRHVVINCTYRDGFLDDQGTPGPDGVFEDLLYEGSGDSDDEDMTP